MTKMIHSTPGRWAQWTAQGGGDSFLELDPCLAFSTDFNVAHASGEICDDLESLEEIGDAALTEEMKSLDEASDEDFSDFERRLDEDD